MTAAVRKLMPSGLIPGFKLAGRQTVRAEQQMTSDMQLSMSERAGGGGGGGGGPPRTGGGWGVGLPWLTIRA